MDQSDVQPKGWSTAEALDFSKPLGDCNLYGQQGAANFGPYTSAGVLHKEGVSQTWAALAEALEPSSPSTIWEAAIRWYDHMQLGLGKQTPTGIAEKKAKIADKNKKKV
jgi:hypothetical protein